MLYPFWHETAIRFLDCVVIGIWFVGHFAAMKHKHQLVREKSSRIPFHNYTQN